MLLKERIESLTNEYLQECEKHKIHHIEISIPGHNGYFWIIDASSLLVSIKNDFELVICFSVNHQSNKGKRIVQSIEVLNLFRGYKEMRDRRYISFSKGTDNDSSSIASEIISTINALFPTLDHGQVHVELKRLENWMVIH